MARRPTPTRNAKTATTGRNAVRKGPRKAARKPTTSRDVASTITAAGRQAAREGPRTVTPYLVVADGKAALDWYAKAIGAVELSRNLTPDGKLLHGAFRIGDTNLFVSDAFPGADVKDPKSAGATTVNLHVQHPDIDRLFQQAEANGARVTMPIANQFWGERYGRLIDPFGHSWAFSHEAKMTAAEKARMRKEAMAQF